MGNIATLEGFATIPHQYNIWLELIEKMTTVKLSELSNKTSFELFLCILSDNLSEESPRAVKMTAQFFGRVRSKLVSISLTFFCDNISKLDRFVTDGIIFSYKTVLLFETIPLFG